MGSAGGREDTGLNRELFRAPYRFAFFQAVRLLEHRWRERAAESDAPRHQPVGNDDLRLELVRFRALPALSFPSATIVSLRETNGSEANALEPSHAEMIVSFFGLTGPSGVLPRHYTELLLNRLRDKDYSLRDFLDLFNHRLISLFYRAWEKYRLPLGYERSQLDDPGRVPDLATRSLYCLVGMGTPGLRGRQDLDDEVFLYFAGHFAHFPRSAAALECLLLDFLEMPVQVHQLRGQWLDLDPADQTRMPNRLDPAGRNNQLGLSTVVGERVWDIQSKFRLRIGPLTWRQFRTLMPDGTALRPLSQLTRCYVGLEFDFDIQPVLLASEVPWTRLSDDPADGPRLGWNTWMRTQPFEQDVDDATFVSREN